jgi:Zn-dependent protease/predicted transcriptional regulator
LKIGAISGIDIRIHFTFLFLLLWALAQGTGDLGAGGAAGALYALVSLLLVFACITLHELGHSLAARRLGIQVRNITLLPIGGIAQLESLPEKPLHELVIALAGPAVNFLLALVLGLALGLLGGASLFLDLGRLSYVLAGERSLLSLTVYLLAANLILGLFNLIPAFPMDGGRVLRAFLAMWTTFPRATLIAARVGQAMAVALLLLSFTRLGGLSLVLVALFVFTGASFEEQAVRARARLDGLRVRHALPMQTTRAVAAEDTLARVLELGFPNHQQHFPVLRGGVLVGILSRDDLMVAIQHGGGFAPVAQAMQREFPTISPDDPLLRAQQLIVKTGLRALPVLDRGHFLGFISLEDLRRAYANLSWRRR